MPQEEISQVSPRLFVPHQRFASLLFDLFLIRLEKLGKLPVSAALLGSQVCIEFGRLIDSRCQTMPNAPVSR